MQKPPLYVSRKNAQEAEYTMDILAVGALKSLLQSLSDSIEYLAGEGSFQLRTVSGGDSFVGLTSGEDAVVGGYTVQVVALAAVHKLYRQPSIVLSILETVR